MTITTQAGQPDPKQFEESGKARRVLEAEPTKAQSPEIHSYEQDDNGDLLIRVPKKFLDKDNPPTHVSEKGKSKIITSSRGGKVVQVPDFGPVTISLNIYVPIKSNGS